MQAQESRLSRIQSCERIVQVVTTKIKSIGHKYAYHHGCRPSHGKNGANEGHFSVPGNRVPWRNFCWFQKTVPSFLPPAGCSLCRPQILLVGSGGARIHVAPWWKCIRRLQVVVPTRAKQLISTNPTPQRRGG